jgi:PAS domain S-box-containing protein
MNTTSQQLVQDRVEELHNNTDFVNALFESLVGYAIIAADFDGNIIAYNEGARQIYGYAPEEVIGKQAIEIFFPEDFIEAGKLQEIIDDLIDKGRFSYEGEKVRKSGERFPAQVLFTLTRDKNGKVVGFIEIVQDLTKRKRLQQQLLNNLENFRKVITNNADGIIIINKKGLVTFVNPAAEAIFARKAKDLLGKQFGFPVVAGETTEVDIIRKGRTPGVAEMRVVETEWEEGTAYLASLRDVSERKQAEELLRESEEKYRDLYSNAPTAYFSVGPDGFIKESNKAPSSGWVILKMSSEKYQSLTFTRKSQNLKANRCLIRDSSKAWTL